MNGLRYYLLKDVNIGVKIKLVIGKVKVRNLLLKVLIVFIYYDNLNKFKCIDLYVEIIRV